MIKKLLVVLITMLCMNLLGSVGVCAESEDNGTLKWMMPPDGYGDGENRLFAYDIQAVVDEEEKSTTYDNGGYYVCVKIGDNKQRLFYEMTKDTEQFIDCDGNVMEEKPTEGDFLGVKVNPSFISGQDHAVKIKFTVTNYSSNDQTFSLGSGADIQIGSNDDADVTMLKDNKSFTMLEGTDEDSIRYIFMGNPTDEFPQITEVDHIWIGQYGWCFYNDYAFSNNPQDLNNHDSAMTFSWIDEQIDANESKDYSVVFMVGLAKEIEEPSVTEKPTASPAAGTYLTTQNVKLSCETEDAEIYYTLDGTDPTSESPKYSGEEIEISETTTLKAIAIHDEVASEVAVFHYVIGSSVIRGTVLQDDTPVSDAIIHIKKGSHDVSDPITTDENGNFEFADIPFGSYNLFIDNNGIITTELLEVNDRDITISTEVPLGKKVSNLVIAEDVPDIAVGGLSDMFNDSDNFTENDQIKIGKGETVEFKLKIDSEEEPTQEITQKVQNAIVGNERAGIYLDINLFKIVNNSEQAIHTVSKEFTLVIPVPDDLKGKGPYKVIRAHEDPKTSAYATDVLEDLDGDPCDDSITVKTDRFSIYAIAYTSSGTSNGSKRRGSSSSQNDSEDFNWRELVKDINAANAGDRFQISAAKDQLIPVSVFKALRNKEDVSLRIRYMGRHAITILSDKVEVPPKNRYAYPVKLLIELYDNENVADKTEDKQSVPLKTNEKAIPSTGANGSNSIAGFIGLAVLTICSSLVRKKKK